MCIRDSLPRADDGLSAARGVFGIGSVEWSCDDLLFMSRLRRTSETVRGQPVATDVARHDARRERRGHADDGAAWSEALGGLPADRFYQTRRVGRVRVHAKDVAVTDVWYLICKLCIAVLLALGNRASGL